MKQERDKTLQEIAEKALSDSVVRLELWNLDTYRDYVMFYDVENPTQYNKTDLGDNPSYKTKFIVEEYISYASGFFVDKHMIVTNFHVAQEANSIIAELVSKQKEFQIESVEAYDFENNLVLLKVSAEGVPLTIGDSNKIEGEDDICAVGYPNGNPEITYGVIDSIIQRNQLIRMKIATTDGSCGSPIFNRHGHTIGVDVTGNEVYSFAIPSNTLKELINQPVISIPLKEWQKMPEIRAFTETREGNRWMNVGEYKKAIAHYDTAIKLKSDMVQAYVGRAEAKKELWAIGTGIEDLFTLKRLAPVQFGFFNFTKYVTWKIGLVKLIGVHLFFKLVRFMIGNCGWFRLKGHVKIVGAKTEVKEGNKSKAKMIFQEAIHDFTVAISIKPKVLASYNSRGWAKYLLGKIETEDANKQMAERLYHEAISDVDAALQLLTENSKYNAAFYHTRGIAKAALGEHQEAIIDLTECIRLRPKNAVYYHDRGLSNAALGQDEAAEADFAKAKQIDPELDEKE